MTEEYAYDIDTPEVEGDEAVTTNATVKQEEVTKEDVK